jgi:integrase
MLVTNPALLYSLSLGSKASRDVTRSKLTQIAELESSTLDDYSWNELNPVKIQALLLKLEDKGLSFSSVNAYLSALKGVAKQAWRNGDMDGDILARIKDIPNRRGSRLPAGQAVNVDDVDKLFETCKNDGIGVRGLRDAAVLALGFYVGLRRFELGAVKLSDIDPVMGTLNVIGKGNKERQVPVSRAAMVHLNAWIKARIKAINDKSIKGNYLFGKVHGRSGELLDLNGLTGDAIRKILVRVCTVSKVNFNQLPSPHDMRRTAVTNWLQKGDPRVAQALAGHEHIQTTMGYARDNLTDKMRAVVDNKD